MAASAALPDIQAQNFFKVLSLIDRTVLPRRLTLTNGASSLVLTVARQCASLTDTGMDTPSGSLEGVAAAIVHLCAGGRPISHRLEPSSRRGSEPAGFPAIAIVHAQAGHVSPDEAGKTRHYLFAKTGWPLALPANASFTAFRAAARIAWTISRWEDRHGGKLSPPMLILAVSEEISEGLSVSVEGGLTVTTTPPAQLGHLVSRWRNRPHDDGDGRGRVG